MLANVDDMLVPVENVPFNIFDTEYSTSWQAVMAKFTETANEIEASVKLFIDRSAGTLRSSEGAFDFLMKLRQTQSKSAIIQQVCERRACVSES